eukprot:s3016_g2.t1
MFPRLVHATVQPQQWFLRHSLVGQTRGLNRACGLVGYPNVGKSSLFNAFAGAAVAAAENFPFCTIEPNIVKVGVPDPRLDRLAELFSSQRTVPGQVEIRDIAGLIKGASTGAGMGNAFLSQIRGVQVVFHVVRCFSDQKVVHVEDPINIDPVKEYESILEELVIADLEYASKRLPALRKKATTAPSTGSDPAKMLAVYEEILKCLEDGKPARYALARQDEDCFDDFLAQLITAKPVVVLANVAAKDAANGNEFTARLAEHVQTDAQALGGLASRFIIVSAQLEAEVAALDDKDFQAEYLESFGLDTNSPRALSRVLAESQSLLKLISFLTVGEMEARAWFVPLGSRAHEASNLHGYC